MASEWFPKPSFFMGFFLVEKSNYASEAGVFCPEEGQNFLGLFSTILIFLYAAKLKSPKRWLRVFEYFRLGL
ncbi:hypothetical protein D3C86_887130 [compost metagenome]